MRLIVVAVACAGVLLSGAVTNAEVSVAVGPTTIPRGDAIGARDLTISNELFAIAIAVDTAPPWGVARGGILDIAVMKDGAPGYDIASLADFMPNQWSGWPTTYQRVTLTKETPDEVVVKTSRDWGEVALETTFTVRDGDRKIHIVTHMSSRSESSLDGLMSGYIVWPDGGSLFGVPGLYGEQSGSEEKALSIWSAAYGEEWALGLHAPFAEYLDWGGRDRYLQHDLLPGATRTFEAWLQIENEGSLSALVSAEIDFGDLPYGRVSGRVTDNVGEVVSRPAIVVSKGGSPYVWTLGNDGDYAIDLPAGDYEVYATASGYAQGAIRNVSVADGSNTRIDFDDVSPPGILNIKVADMDSGETLDARISIRKGPKSLIGFFAKDTLFTELESVGETTVSIAPGNYELEVSAGGGFISSRKRVAVVVESGKPSELPVDVAVTAKPRERGWYSADLHHHSDVLDGFTEAEFVLRSELAAGVDLAFLSDHDSVVNNDRMRVLSDSRDLQFIPATELSPSWGHFNAYPLDDGTRVDIDTGQATVQEIFAAARRMGADIIEVNHPYSSYGYFENHDRKTIRGDYDDGFDLVEIGPLLDNRDQPARNTDTVNRVWRLWNEGRRVYLAGGSDVHDVWLRESGSARTYVYVDAELSVENFVAGLKAGHAYASQGPLVYPDILFGSDVEHAAGIELALTYTVQAVSGLKSVHLIEQGEEIDAVRGSGEQGLVPVAFSVNPDADTWYSLVIEDMSGKFAYTNPVWVSVAN